MARTVMALCLLVGLLLFAPSMGGDSSGDSSSVLSQIGVQELHAQQPPPCEVWLLCINGECWLIIYCPD